MELRKVEQELERLSNEWKSLRRKNPVFDGENAGADSNNDIVGLPSMKELSLRINDEDIYPNPPPECEDGECDTEMAVEGEGRVEVDGEIADGNSSEPAPVDGLATFNVGDTTDDTKPVENDIAEPEMGADPKMDSVKFKAQEDKTQTDQCYDDEEEDEEITTKENESPEKILATLDALRESIISLRAKIDKFCNRLIEKDPISKKPRYGEQTAIRVKKVIRRFKTLELGVSIAFDDPEFSNLNPACSVKQNRTSHVSSYTTSKNNIVSSLRIQIQQHNEKIQAELHAKKTKEQMEAERVAHEKSLAEQMVIEQQRLEEQKKREEERILAQRAQEARQRRAEEEQRALEAERDADRQLLELVPVKGPEGVRMHIERMRESLKDDKTALDVALGSLYTIFDQIVRKPEEVNFRRIRRDHPKFMEDIGRHVGGREVLIAAGFRLEKLDGVPSFFSREPHIETDMDGWSDWFDGLKKTLEILEEEMMK